MTSTSPTRKLSTDRHAEWMLVAGPLAGCTFLIVSFAQVAIREGFDLSKHPLSALSLGDGGWLQVSNFVLTGVLALFFAAGVRLALHPGRAGTWGPILIGGYGLGLIMSGIFKTDPGYGFPAGAPAGMPAEFSSSAILHAVFATIAFTSIVAAGGVLARRFAALRQPLWATYCAISAAAAFILIALPSSDGASIRFAVGALLTSGWLIVLGLRLIAESNRQEGSAGWDSVSSAP